MRSQTTCPCFLHVGEVPVFHALYKELQESLDLIKYVNL